MEQDQGDKVPEQAEARDEVAVEAGAEVLRQALAATASAPSAGKKLRTNWARPAMSSDALNVGPR